MVDQNQNQSGSYLGSKYSALFLFQTSEVRVTFKNEEMAVQAFQSSERIVRPRDQDYNTERPKIVATFERTDVRRKVVPRQVIKPQEVALVLSSGNSLCDFKMTNFKLHVRLV